MIVRKSPTYLIKRSILRYPILKSQQDLNIKLSNKFIRLFSTTNNKNDKYKSIFKDLDFNKFVKQVEKADKSFNNQGSDQIFQSQHYQVKTQDIIDFLNKFNIHHSLKSNQITLHTCPLCSKPHNNDRTNLYTCSIESAKGMFHCFRCGSKGGWYDFKNKVIQKFFGSSLNDFIKPQFQQDQQVLNETIEGIPSESIGTKFEVKQAYTYYQNAEKEIYPEIVKFLTGRENSEQRWLNKETLQTFKVGVGKEKFRNDNNQLSMFDCVYFPLYQPRSKKVKQQKKEVPVGSLKMKDLKQEYEAELAINTDEYELIKMKVRAIGSDNKHRQRLMPVGSQLQGLFGLNTVKDSDKVIFITEGEFDAMAVYQETSIPAVSLPNGANNLPLQFLPFFERFERIYLWMDADEVGRTAAEKFAKKLGPNRTLIIDSRKKNEEGPKDANDALRMGLNFNQIISQCSQTINDQNLLSFTDLKEKVMRRILNFEQITGVQSQYFNFYNKTLKGFRRGEFTLITGATGSGKTTFLSQLSIDFLTQGIPTLWGSFEIKNEILASTMLSQYSRKKLTDKDERIDLVMEQFEQFPLYFMNFYGSTPIELMFETLEYAIYAYDISLICLDNMQFMLSQQALGLQKFELQDKVASMLRQLATEKNVHICLVIHPKKVEDDTHLTVGSIFGTAKVTQEADTVMILQKSTVPNFRKLEIKKNRFDGDVGEVSLAFNADNKRYFEITEQEKRDLLITGGSFNKLKDNRIKKFGCVEPLSPTQIQSDLKINNKLQKPAQPKIKKEVDNDLKFYKKLKKQEQRDVLKNKHLFYSSNSSSESGGEDGNDPLNDQDKDDMIVIDDATQDLSISEIELQLLALKNQLNTQGEQQQELIEQKESQDQEPENKEEVKQHYNQFIKELDNSDNLQYQQIIKIKQKAKDPIMDFEYEFPTKYTMDEKEVEVNDEVKDLKLSDNNFKERHNISMPKWVDEIEPIDTFYNEIEVKQKTSNKENSINVEVDEDSWIQEQMIDAQEKEKETKSLLKSFFKKDNKK